MDDLARWLRDQLNADEAAAEACLPLHLRVGRFRGAQIPRWRITKSGTGIIDEDGGTLRAQQIFPAEADHVIRHDPARVLREIEAKREVVKQYERAFENRRAHPSDLASAGALLALHGVVKALAKSYSHRPGFAEAIASAG